MLETVAEFMKIPQSVAAKLSKPPRHAEEAEEGPRSSLSSLLWAHI